MIRILAAALVLMATAAFAEKPVRVVHVLVTQADGEPVAGVEVRCMPQHHHAIRVAPPTDAERAISNAHGIAAFALTHSGIHIVHAWHEDLGAALQLHQRRGETQTVTLTLQPARMVSGRIIDPRGNPLQGVQFLAFRGIPLGETDSNGYYRIRTLGSLGMPDAWLYKVGYAGQSFSFASNHGWYEIVLPPSSPPEFADPPPAPATTPSPPPPADFTAAPAHEPPARERTVAPVRITVVDEDGEPVPHVRLIILESINAASATSGEDGAIHGWHEWDGPVSWRVAQASVLHRLFIGTFNNHLQAEQQITMLSQELDANTPEDLLNLRVRVERASLRFMRGRILSEDGEPLRTRIEVLTDGFPRPSPLVQVREGWFMIRDMPDMPFALEFVHQGYKPRVLASGIDFNPGDEIEVILEHGPFPPRASIWAAVTGQLATQEAVDSFPGGARVRERERDYLRQATASETDIPARRGPQPPFPVRVVDAAGEPVREIMAQALQPTLMEVPAFHEARPDPDDDVDILHSDDGNFELPSDYTIVWAEGMGWELFFRGGWPLSETRTLVLHPPARITVTVRDADGQPVPGAWVGPPGVLHHIARSQSGLPRGIERFGVRTTDENGQADLGEWPIDFEYFSAVRGDERQQPASAYANPRPGETSAIEIVLPPWPEGSGAAMLDEWRGQRGAFQGFAIGRQELDPLGTAFLEAVAQKRREVIPNLQPGQREEIALELVRRIDTAPGAIAHADMHFYANVALALEVREAAEPLFQWLERADSRHFGRLSRRSAMTASSVEPVLKAIILLGGGDADGFARLAADPSADPAARVAGVVALGMMGTDESIAAWRALRASMQGDPLMPARSPDDSHEDRMTEAIALTMFVAPYLGEESPAAADALPINVRSVDDNYEFGQATVGIARAGGSTQVTLRRFGEDWLVIAISGTRYVS